MASVKAATRSSSVRSGVGVRAVEVQHQALGVGPVAELSQVRTARRVERAETVAPPVVGGPAYEAVVTLVLGQHAGQRVPADQRTVTGDDMVGAERGDPLQRAQRPVDRAHEHQRRQPVEQQVTGEQDPLLGKPRHDVAGRVGGEPGVAQVDPPPSGEDGHLRTEHRVRDPPGDLPPVGHRRPERRAAVDDRVGQLRLTRGLVRDEQRRRGQETVAVGVVAVQVRVDRDPHRHAAGRRGDRVQEPPRTDIGGTGVDEDHTVVAAHGARVVDPPGAVGLRPGVHTVDDLPQHRGVGRGFGHAGDCVPVASSARSRTTEKPTVRISA